MVRLVDRNGDAYKSLIAEYPDFEKTVAEYTDMGFSIENALHFTCDYYGEKDDKKFIFDIFDVEYRPYELTPPEMLIAFDYNLLQDIPYEYINGYRDACEGIQKYYMIDLDV